MKQRIFFVYGILRMGVKKSNCRMLLVENVHGLNIDRFYFIQYYKIKLVADCL